MPDPLWIAIPAESYPRYSCFLNPDCLDWVECKFYRSCYWSNAYFSINGADTWDWIFNWCK